MKIQEHGRFLTGIILYMIRKENTLISIKAITSSFLAIAFCFSLSVSGSAERLESIGNELYSDHEGFDTLSLTQAEYENLLSINHVGVTTNAYVNDSIELSDIQIIEEICKVHIATSRAYVRDPDNYSKTTFFSPEANDNQLVKNHISQYDYLNSLYEAKDWTVYSDNLSFSEYNVEINGDYANASIVEEYSYDINNGFDELCWLSREYSITLRKSLGNWYITCITTDSPIERKEIDIEVQIALIDHPVEAPSILDDLSTHSNIVPMSSSLYSWLYNAEDAIEYAKTYYKNANPLFGKNDSDCQNFVSQCVWAGLGGTSISDVPCVSYDLVGHNATNLWCHNQYSNYYSNYKYNWAWDNVVGFFT